MNSISPTVQLTAMQVADRFRDAFFTARSLPPERMQGYFNAWPTILRQSWEGIGADVQHRPCRFPPTGKAVDEMLETMRWIQVLEESDRHIVWGYARKIPRLIIAKKLGIGRTTLHRRYASAIQKITDHLNQRH